MWTDLVIRILMSTQEYLYQPGHDFWKGPLSPALIDAIFFSFFLMLCTKGLTFTTATDQQVHRQLVNLFIEMLQKIINCTECKASVRVV